MTDEAKEYAERAYLEIFKDLYTEFPQGEIDKRESPDFVIGGPIGIGIEVTRIEHRTSVGPFHTTQDYAELNRLCEETTKLYDTLGGAPVLVSVFVQHALPRLKTKASQGR